MARCEETLPLTGPAPQLHSSFELAAFARPATRQQWERCLPALISRAGSWNSSRLGSIMGSCVSLSLLLSLLLLAVHEGLAATRRLHEAPTQAAGPADDLEAYRRAGCDNFTGQIWEPLRPGFHITIPYGWMNDPHGMFELNGTTHVFFQYNPKKIQWGAPFWGHVASKDLVRWTWLPPALLPDSKYDFNGIWSGAATVTETGSPYLTYTAAGTLIPEMGNFFQTQAMAVPVNPADPWLKAWRKLDTNPFLVQVPPGGTNTQFRDPTEGRHAVWIALTSPDNPNPLPKSSFALAVGVQSFCLGGGAIYAAPQMTGPWEYLGSLYNQLTIEPQIDGQCMPSRTYNGSWPGPAYGGPCDQFGAFCRMWEVVDFAELEPGLFFLKWDDQSSFRGDFNIEWYVLGNGPFDYSALRPLAASSSRAAANTTSTNATNATKANANTTAVSQPGLQPKTSFFGSAYSNYPGTTTPAITAANSGRSSDFNHASSAAASVTKSLFKGELDGQKYAPMQTDYGSIYASMVFRTSNGRQVMFSWIYETAAGCQGSCSDQLPAVVAKQGFKGVQTLPRQLSFDKATKTLRAYPVRETELLRGKQLVNKTGTSLTPSPTILVPLGSVPAAASSGGGANTMTARQFEIQANLTLQPSAAGSSNANANASSSSSSGRVASNLTRSLAANEFAFGVRILTGGSSYTDIVLKGSLATTPAAAAASNATGGQSQQQYAITGLSVWVDRTAAGNASNTSYIEGGPVPLPIVSAAGGAGGWAVPSRQLGLSVWVDHTVLEVFALGGLARVTSRIYPEGDDVAWGVSTWSVPPRIAGVLSAADLLVWDVNNMWLPPNC